MTNQASAGHASASTAESIARAYRFGRFSTALLIDDMTYGRQAPGPGDPIPPFDLSALDGGRFRSDDLGGLPVLLVTGSRTCPVTESAGPAGEAGPSAGDVGAHGSGGGVTAMDRHAVETSLGRRLLRFRCASIAAGSPDAPRGLRCQYASTWRRQ